MFMYLSTIVNRNGKLLLITKRELTNDLCLSPVGSAVIIYY